MVVKGRVLVGELLPKFIGGRVGSQLCPLYNKVIESADHLFVTCVWTWVIWSTCLNWWGIAACVSRRMVEWMNAWMVLCPIAKSHRVWKVLFHAICWTVWEVNRVDGVGNIKNMEIILDIMEIVKRVSNVSVIFGPRGGNISVDFLSYIVDLGSISGDSETVVLDMSTLVWTETTVRAERMARSLEGVTLISKSLEIKIHHCC
ncbi:hypothetical protein QYF36_008327 [Acer negundo]|nr:hypothetical protein QYF36_008327 [Acer negundo]